MKKRLPAPLLIIFALALSAVGSLSAQSAELKPETIKAFDQYIRAAEARMEPHIRGEKPFLWADQDPDRLAQVRQGRVITKPVEKSSEQKVPDGLIHDWVGSVFIKGADLAGTLAMVQNYDHHKNVFKPEVIDSKLLGHNGNDYKIYLRLLKKKVITVVLNTNHDVRYIPLDRTRWHSRSYSTRIAEVDNAGRPDEEEKPVGHDNGFLWRLHSYWRFMERDGGVYIECEAISLTRDVPTGLGWMINPIIRNLPRESLENTLNATRAVVQSRTKSGG